MYLLVINGTYTTIEVALMCDGQLRASKSFSHLHASTQLLTAIETLCKEHSLTIQDISACAVNAGPGPFTTMRSIIATINGIAYATELPLISVNGLEAFARSEQKQDYTHTFVLLNAFCRDVYYAEFAYETGVVETGCCSIDYWIERLQAFLKKHPHARIHFAGNGCTIYQQELATAYGMNFIPEHVQEVVSLKAIAHTAWEQWQAQKYIVHQITPLYLKAYAPHSR